MTWRAKEVARIVQRLGVEDSIYDVREVARRSSLLRLHRLFARLHPAPRQDTPVQQPSSVFLSASKRRCPTSCSFHGTLHSRPTRQVNRCHCNLYTRAHTLITILRTHVRVVTFVDTASHTSPRFPAITRLRCRHLAWPLGVYTTRKFRPPYPKALICILLSLPPFLSSHTCICVHEETWGRKHVTWEYTYRRYSNQQAESRMHTNNTLLRWHTRTLRYILWGNTERWSRRQFSISALATA